MEKGPQHGVLLLRDVLLVESKMRYRPWGVEYKCREREGVSSTLVTVEFDWPHKNNYQFRAGHNIKRGKGTITVSNFYIRGELCPFSILSFSPLSFSTLYATY